MRRRNKQAVSFGQFPHLKRQAPHAYHWFISLKNSLSEEVLKFPLSPTHYSQRKAGKTEEQDNSSY